HEQGRRTRRVAQRIDAFTIALRAIVNRHVKVAAVAESSGGGRLELVDRQIAPAMRSQRADVIVQAIGIDLPAVVREHRNPGRAHAAGGLRSTRTGTAAGMPARTRSDAASPSAALPTVTRKGAKRSPTSTEP